MKQDEIAELFDKFNSVLFDDRINRKVTTELIWQKCITIDVILIKR